MSTDYFLFSPAHQKSAMVGSIGMSAASALATPVSLVAGIGISAIQVGAVMVKDSPAGAAITLGTGALLYLASHEMVKASQADGMIGKIFHGTMATIGAVATVAVPVAYALS